MKKNNNSNIKVVPFYLIILSVLSVFIGCLFVLQMYWVMKHSEIDSQIHRLEKNYALLTIENQKKLIEINRRTNIPHHSKLQLSQLKKINIKNIPIVTYR